METITREMLADAFEHTGDADIVWLLQDPKLTWQEKASKLREDYALPEETIRALTYEP